MERLVSKSTHLTINNVSLIDYFYLTVQREAAKSKVYENSDNGMQSYRWAQ